MHFGTRSVKISEIAESVINLFDNNETETGAEPLGARLFQKFLKEFDKYFLLSNNSTHKSIVSNAMKSLLAFSNSAKRASLNGFILILLKFQKFFI